VQQEAARVLVYAYTMSAQRVLQTIVLFCSARLPV